MRTDSKRPPGPWVRCRAMTMRSRCRSPTTAASDQSKPCLTGSTINRLMSMNSRFTLPTSMTFSSLSPATLTHRKAMYDDQSFLCSARFGHHAAARCPALAAPPLDDAEWPADADRHAGAVRLRVRRDVGRWPWRRGAWRCLHQLRRARDYPHDCGQRVRDDCDQPLHGHEG